MVGHVPARQVKLGSTLKAIARIVYLDELLDGKYVCTGEEGQVVNVANLPKFIRMFLT